MRKALIGLVAAATLVMVPAAPALACYRSHYRDRPGYYDDDCDSDGYYCDGRGYWRSDDDDYYYHRRYYYDHGSCVFHEAVGAITVDFLCRYR